MSKIHLDKYRITVAGIGYIGNGFVFKKRNRRFINVYNRK